jgi:hypothetical protein
VGNIVPIQAEPGRIFCENGHTFQDTEALQSRNPKPIAGMKIPTPPKAPTNTLEVRFKVHPKFKEALDQRFGDRLEATMPALLSCILDPAAFFIAGEDAEMMSRALGGEKIKDGKSITGKFFALSEELKNLKAENESLKKSVGSAAAVKNGDNGIMVSIDPDTMTKLTAKAVQRKQTEAGVIADTMWFALKENWL